MKEAVTRTECELPAAETRGTSPFKLVAASKGRWCLASSKGSCLDPPDWARIIKRAKSISFTLSFTQCRFSLLLITCFICSSGVALLQVQRCYCVSDLKAHLDMLQV